MLDVIAHGAPVALDELERQLPGAKPAVRELVKAGLVAITDREVSLDAVATSPDMLVIPPPVLTGEQVIAVGEITAALK